MTDRPLPLHGIRVLELAQIVAGAAKDSGTVRQYIAAFEAAGADEVICFPASTDAGQVDLLADAALR